jgi:hypothetical protein
MAKNSMRALLFDCIRVIVQLEPNVIVLVSMASKISKAVFAFSKEDSFPV